MKKITDAEVKKAFNIWRAKYEPREDEESLTPFLVDKIISFTVNQQGWLKKVRRGLFLSSTTVAKKLDIARAAYSKYEEGEETGTITLATLARAAEAMDCELVYAIRPRNRKYFSNIIWETLLPMAMIHPWLKKCDQRRRAEALAFVASTLMADPKFRKEHAWSQRANKSNH